MIAKAQQRYRGVLCIHCGQRIPLSPSAEQKEKVLQEQAPSGLEEFAVRSATLRCSVCHCKGVYKHSDVIEFEGVPRKTVSHVRKSCC